MEKLGKYQIVEKIGTGGFGVVYRATDPFIKRNVAIKTCSAGDTETRERFLREAEICGNLHHRNIVTVYEFGFEDDTPYLVQEYLSGEDLDKKIKRRDFLPMPERILWLLQIARGLAYAHERGIIHRDIKPGNIRILEDGTAKILDFGIAKLAQQQSSLTQAGITLGTAAYLAPEQIRGEPVDPRTDVFSFGVLAFELLAFERPFHAREISAIFYKILNEPPPPLRPLAPDCPAPLIDIVLRCLEKSAARRFSPTDQLATALETLVRRRSHDAHTEPTRGITVPPVTEEPTAIVAPTAKAAIPTAAPAADRSRGAGGLDEVELSYPRGTPRPQSRAMATMAFGGEGHAKRWRNAALAGLGAAVLLALGLLLTRPVAPPSSSNLAATPAPAETPASTLATSPGLVPLPGPAPGVAPVPGEDPAAAREEPPAATPPPTPEPPRLGRLVVGPAWDPAMVLRVGTRRVRLDRTQTLELAAGNHDLTFSLETPSYTLEQALRVQIAAGGTRMVEIPLARPGRLTVQPHLNTRPGSVRLDGQMIGSAPIRGRWLSPGEHLVEVFPAQALGGEPTILHTLVIESGQETILTFDLEGQIETQVRSRPVTEG